MDGEVGKNMNFNTKYKINKNQILLIRDQTP